MFMVRMLIKDHITAKSNLLGALLHIDSNLIFPLVKFHHKHLKLHLFLLFISFI